VDVFRRFKGLRDPDRTERRRQRRIKKTLRWGYLADPGTSSARRDATTRIMNSQRGGYGQGGGG
jgi:hypothetical protein